MTSAAKKILADALALPEDMRMELVAALSDSLEPAPPGLSSEWRAEISRRIEQVERGEAELLSWEQVQATIHKRLAHRR